MALIKKTETENQKRLAKCIGQISGTMEAAIAEHEKHTLFFISEIEALDKEIREQVVKRNEAAENNDNAGFRAAAKAVAAAEVEKRQFEESLAEVQRRPIISKGQAETFMRELQEIQEAISNEANEQIRTLVLQIIKADDEAEKIQNDLIKFAQGLREQAQDMIRQDADALRCNGAAVNTIVGAGPTSPFNWHKLADTLRKDAARFGYELTI